MCPNRKNPPNCTHLSNFASIRNVWSSVTFHCGDRQCRFFRPF
jgi:hypothetical protein